MIHFIGDAHGKMFELRKIVERLAPEPTFQLGDMGLGFKGVVLPPQRETFQWIRGNHDNPERCYEHPNYMGDMGLMELEGRRMFWLAGAYSIDKDWRISGISWWPDEELSPEALASAVAVYKEVKPDLVMSHECPSSVARILLNELIVGGDRNASYFEAKFGCVQSRTAAALQEMFKAHQPRDWVFGHYHVDKHLKVEDTNFRCVAELSTYTLPQE